MRIIGPRPVERNGLRGFVTTFHFGNTHSQPAKGESDAKYAHDDSVYENNLTFGAGYAVAQEECQPLRKHQNAPTESVSDTISVTNSHSPDPSSHQVNSPASTSSPEPGTPFQAKASEDNGATGSDREVPTDCMTGEVSRVDAGRTASATSENGRDSVERHAPHSHASRNGEGA